MDPENEIHFWLGVGFVISVLIVVVRHAMLQ